MMFLMVLVDLFFLSKILATLLALSEMTNPRYFNALTSSIFFLSPSDSIRLLSLSYVMFHVSTSSVCSGDFSLFLPKLRYLHFFD